MHTNSKQGAMTYWRRVVVNVSCCHFEELMTYKPRSWFRRSCILVAIGRVTFAILGSGSRETKLCYHWSGTFALYTHCRSVHLYVAKNLFVRERELVFMESDLVFDWPFIWVCLPVVYCWRPNILFRYIPWCCSPLNKECEHTEIRSLILSYCNTPVLCTANRQRADRSYKKFT